MAQPQESSAPPQTPSTGARFSIEAVAKEQGVSPVTDVDQVANQWPGADDDPAALEEFILRERKERREVAANRPPAT